MRQARCKTVCRYLWAAAFGQNTLPYKVRPQQRILLFLPRQEAVILNIFSRLLYYLAAHRILVYQRAFVLEINYAGNGRSHLGFDSSLERVCDLAENIACYDSLSDLCKPDVDARSL